mgnify:CR=1 FL=1
MKNYKEQNGCFNCKHVFIKMEYDDGYEYFCHHDNSKRPICGSVLMSESFFYEYNGNTKNHIHLSDEEYEKKYNEWEDWANERRVIESGICDYHEKNLI